MGSQQREAKEPPAGRGWIVLQDDAEFTREDGWGASDPALE